MVGIVVVSHSRKLAEGVLEMVNQMTQGRVMVAAAGGVDDPEHPFGTDPLAVKAAIESVFSEDGVLVLMDLGSAVLSAEMALEFLTPAGREKVVLCEAPMVEGAVAAAVQAMNGSDLGQIVQEARAALSAKSSHLGFPAGTPLIAAPLLNGQTISLTITNPLGLHARPAAQFVMTAGRFEATIQICKGDQVADAKSINQVATLAVGQGETILLTASGREAAAALLALEALVKANFGESGSVPQALGRPEIGPAGPNQLIGVPASPGIAIGTAFTYQTSLPVIETQLVTDPAGEWRRLENALSVAQQEIAVLERQAIQTTGTDEAAIFTTHRLFLQDPSLVDGARRAIFDWKINAEAAWHQAYEAMAETYRALENPYIRARATDILDVGQRVLWLLLGLSPPSLVLSEPSVLVANDLTPSETVRLDREKVLAICTALGGATAHSAILARALGIPAVVGLQNGLLERVTMGQQVAVDGGTGRVWLQPTPDQLADLQQQQTAWQAQIARSRLSSQQPAVTTDGRRIEIAANIRNAQEAQEALQLGAEGVGLFRTEFLFMDRLNAPGEEEQYQFYRQVAEVMASRPVIIRTLDVGGDKPIPYLGISQEANPFLGWRGIRFCLSRPELFKSQLRAILRAGAGHNLKIMFPMVTTLAEVQAAKSLLAEAKAELAAGGLPHDPQMEVGVMVEVPAAVIIADQLAQEVAFFSIGSNDLTQYVMAADRGNTNVAGLVNAFHPAVLRMIAQTVEAAHRAGIWVGLCGELAGDPLATPLLVGLGLDELSMSAPAISTVKDSVRGSSSGREQSIAAYALTLHSAQAVQQLLNQKLG